MREGDVIEDSSLSPQSSVLSPAVHPFGRIDVHSHLLPGIDDGCKTAEQSIACARVLVENGYTHAFCTPHLWPTHKHINRASVPRWVAQLQAKLDEAGVALKLLPGGELNLHADVTRTPVEDLVPLGLGKYQLVDMWASELPDFFAESVAWLRGLGLEVILAHPERMRAVQDAPHLVEYFQSIGVLLQGNLQCFSDPRDSMTRICVERFLQEGRYFLLGSDTHNPETIGVRMSGLHRAIELAGADAVRALTHTNPQKLVPDGAMGSFRNTQ